MMIEMADTKKKGEVDYPHNEVPLGLPGGGA